MRLQLPTSSQPASVYRLAACPASDGERDPSPRTATLGVLSWILGCSLLRFALFAVSAPEGERFGAGPALALAALCATSYALLRMRRI